MLNFSVMLLESGSSGITHAKVLATDPIKARRRVDDGRGIIVVVGSNEWRHEHNNTKLTTREILNGIPDRRYLYLVLSSLPIAL
jgi:hypothetical protein